MPHYTRFTTLRPGILGDQNDRARTDMFIDPSPYCSLAGFGLHDHKTTRQKSNMSKKNPRGHTDLGSAAMARSAGRRGRNPHDDNQTGPCNRRGAPPMNPSQARGFWKHGTSKDYD